MFFGEPEKILIEVKAPEAAAPADQPEGGAPPNPEGKQEEVKKEPNLDDSVEVKPQIIPKNFTELDRLAYTIAAIENDTHVVPEGAYKMIPIHEVRRNESFKGIDRKLMRRSKQTRCFEYYKVLSLQKRPRTRKEDFA